MEKLDFKQGQYVFRAGDGAGYLFLLIKYNTTPVIKKKGSAIFIHLTKNYKPTAGCIGLKKKDFLVMLKLINKNTKIKII